MADFINTFIDKLKKDPANSREDMTSSDVKKRMSLAKNSKTNQEILTYLAEHDPEPKVREAVIKNKSLPVAATPVLATDKSQDVRIALAGRLVELLPDMSQDKQSQLYAYVVQALGTLALDEVLKIRKALSSTLKDHAHTPPKIAGQLARDVEREVSEPVLRFCAALSDEDLLDILKGHPASWVVEAVAGRDVVSEVISEAVIETEDRPGGQVLIGNEGAQLTEDLLHIIVEKARSFPEWQEPMATRSSLPVSVIQELAEFVDASVRDILMARSDFDEDTTEEVAEVFKRRLDYAAEESASDESGHERAKRMLGEGSLNENHISDALGMRDYDFVKGALAVLGKTDLAMVEKIFDLNKAKPIVALSWHANLSMRLALQLQKDIGHVQPKEILYPRDGTDYPLSEEEIIWQLEFLGLKAA